MAVETMHESLVVYWAQNVCMCALVEAPFEMETTLLRYHSNRGQPCGGAANYVLYTDLLV